MRLQAFEEYQAKEAWTWERMALTRARVVAGPAEFSARVESAIAEALSRPQDPKSIAADALDMRRRLEREKGAGGLWDLKQTPGGQIDIEFVTQFLELTQRRADGRRFSTAIAEALQELAEIGALPEGDIATLSEATTLYQALTQILRLAVAENFDPKTASRGLTSLVLDAAAAARPLASRSASRRDASRGAGGFCAGHWGGVRQLPARQNACFKATKNPRRGPYCGAKTPMPEPSRSS